MSLIFFMNDKCKTRQQLSKLKSLLITFSKSQLAEFYQKGLAASKAPATPDFYVSLLQDIVKDICDIRGFNYDEVINNDV